MRLSDSKIGTLELAAGMILSGFIGLFVVESGQSSFNVVFFRCLFGSFSLLLYCWWRGFLTTNSFTFRGLSMIIIGGVALILNWILLFSSFQYVPISISTVAYHTQPFFLLAIGAVVFRESFSVHKLIWMVIAFIGLVLIVELDVDSFQGDWTVLKGLGMAMSAAFLYAITTMITKGQKSMRPEMIALVQVSLGIILLAPMASFDMAPTAPRQWGFLAGLGLIHTCLMYVLIYSAYQKLQTSAIAILAFIYPAVAIIVDLVFFDRSISWIQSAGIMLIMASVAGVNLNWRALPKSLVSAKA